MSEDILDNSSKPSGLGIKLGSLLLIIFLVIGLIAAAYFIYTNLSHATGASKELNPSNPELDTNDQETPDINANPDNNTSPGNLNPYIAPPTPISEAKPKLTITAESKSKKKGSKDPIFTVTYSGFKDGDTVSSLSGKLVITRESGEKEGTYAITASGLTSTKYDIAYVPGVFTIKSSGGGGGGGGGDSGGETDPCDNLGQVTFNPGTAIYNSPIAVTLSYAHSNSDCSYNIRYTLDGTEPTISSTLYSSPIDLSNTTAITANVFSVTGNYSGTSTFNLYTFVYDAGTVDPPTANPTPGVVNYNSLVILSSATPDANIYYTIGSNTTPSCSGTQYLSPILIDSNKTIKAIACKPGMTSSAISTFTYTIQTVLDANFSPQPQASNYNVSVSLSTNTSNASIYYNINNANNPGCSSGANSTLYGETITIDSNKTIKAIACKTGWKPSQVITKDYNVLQVTTPTLTVPDTSNYNKVITITSQSGATIYYTLDGSDPTTSSAQYTAGGITLTQTSAVTVKAKAYKDNWIPSNIASQTYPILKVSTPIASPDGNTYEEPQTVTLTSTNSASIKYTTDSGVNLTCNTGQNYSDPITISENTTLRAIGCKDYYIPSNVMTENYTIDTQPPEDGAWLWAKRTGGTNIDAVSKMVVDSQGNSYITGSYQGTMQIGSFTLPNRSNNDRDVFVAKLDPSGEVIWAARAGGTYYDIGNGIAVDSSGNVYVTGTYVSKTAYFGEGTSLSLTGDKTSIKLFVAKLNNNGDWLWLQKAVPGSASDAMISSSDIVVDSQSNVYVTGAFQWQAQFPGLTFDYNGTGTYYETMYGYGYTDCFLAKLDPNGNWLWARKAGGANIDNAKAIALDSQNNVYIAGSFASDDFNYNGDFNLQNSATNNTMDLFVLKLDNSGNSVWAKKANGISSESAPDLTVYNNEIYVTGFIANAATFGTTTLTSSGEFDIFVAKMDLDGNWLWAERAGGAYYDFGWGIAANSSNVYVTGEFKGTATFGNTTLTNPSTTNYDIFTAVLDPSDGSWLSAERFGSPGYNDVGYAVAVDSGGNTYWAGNFFGNIVFGNTTPLDSNANSQDIYIAKKG